MALALLSNVLARQTLVKFDVLSNGDGCHPSSHAHSTPNEPHPCRPCPLSTPFSSHLGHVEAVVPTAHCAYSNEPVPLVEGHRCFRRLQDDGLVAAPLQAYPSSIGAIFAFIVLCCKLLLLVFFLVFFLFIALFFVVFFTLILTIFAFCVFLAPRTTTIFSRFQLFSATASVAAAAAPTTPVLTSTGSISGALALLDVVRVGLACIRLRRLFGVHHPTLATFTLRLFGVHRSRVTRAFQVLNRSGDEGSSAPQGAAQADLGHLRPHHLQ